MLVKKPVLGSDEECDAIYEEATLRAPIFIGRDKDSNDVKEILLSNDTRMVIIIVPTASEKRK